MYFLIRLARAVIYRYFVLSNSLLSLSGFKILLQKLNILLNGTEVDFDFRNFIKFKEVSECRL